jgi:hypothetical protein
MIQLRWFKRFAVEPVLQWRQVECQIGWSKGDDHPVFQPKGPVSLYPERNWTPWEDVPTVEETTEERQIRTEEYAKQYPSPDREGLTSN